MDVERIFSRYQELQRYLAWSDDDARRVQAAAPLVKPHLGGLVDDFYQEIERHPDARRVITGGEPQIERLKQSLHRWLGELLTGPYDKDYVIRRWKVGRRHVEIGLDQIYTNVALSRLHDGALAVLAENWRANPAELMATVRSLNKLFDLDLAKIEDAYQAEYSARQQRTERLAAIGQVAGGIAHELRNPLNVVRTSAYYLLNARSPSPEKVIEHLRRIEQHTTRADGVITALSNFAKMPAPSLNKVTVAQCVKEALEVTRLPTGIEVVVDLPADLPPALGDFDQIRIVFDNLIRNARDAMPGGGKLVVSGRARDGFIEIDFIDSGVGIPPENLGHITEALYSTKAGGLGLGLALARAILEKSRGSLSVASESGRGSTFTVRLPSRENEDD